MKVCWFGWMDALFVLVWLLDRERKMKVRGGTYRSAASAKSQRRKRDSEFVDTANQSDVQDARINAN